MKETQAVLEQMVDRFFAGEIKPATRTSSEAGHWPDALWRGVEAQGLSRPLIPAEQGGLGAGWPEAFVVLRAAGRHAVPLPLAETMIASWLLATAGIAAPEGPLTLCDAQAPSADADPLRLAACGEGWRLSGTARRVPWGGAATAMVLTLAHGGQMRVVLAPRAGAAVARGCNLAGEPRDEVVFLEQPVESAPARRLAIAAPVRVLGAMARCAQITGALDRVLESSVRYASERQQFGRPIARFQAVQHNVAILAGEAAACGVAAEAAFRGAAAGDPTFLVAVAKVRAGLACAQGIAIGHQVHGAIGFTLEHPLQLSTRRLMSWRSEFGADRQWAVQLGRRVLDWGAERFWPELAAY